MCVCRWQGVQLLRVNFFLIFKKNIMSFYESASVSADVIITLATEISLSMFIETVNLQIFQKNEEAEIEST